MCHQVRQVACHRTDNLTKRSNIHNSDKQHLNFSFPFLEPIIGKTFYCQPLPSKIEGYTY